METIAANGSMDAQSGDSLTSGASQTLSPSSAENVAPKDTRSLTRSVMGNLRRDRLDDVLVDAALREEEVMRKVRDSQTKVEGISGANIHSSEGVSEEDSLAFLARSIVGGLDRWVLEELLVDVALNDPTIMMDIIHLNSGTQDEISLMYEKILRRPTSSGSNVSSDTFRSSPNRADLPTPPSEKSGRSSGPRFSKKSHHRRSRYIPSAKRSHSDGAMEIDSEPDEDLDDVERELLGLGKRVKAQVLDSQAEPQDSEADDDLDDVERELLGFSKDAEDKGLALSPLNGASNGERLASDMSDT